MFRSKLTKMAHEMNDLKGILFLVLCAIPMIASININCNGKAFHCVNSTHFMICVDLGGGLSTTIDDFVFPCPATTVCREQNIFECDFPEVEVVPPLQVLGVYKQSDTSETTLVTDSVTTPTPTSDVFSEFIENVTATTLPIPEEVTPILILEEHIQQPTQVDNGNTVDSNLPVNSNFIGNTETETSTDKVPDPLLDQSKLLDSVTSITGTFDLISVLPGNVTMTTSPPDVSNSVNNTHANISPNKIYQNNTQQVTKQDDNAKNVTHKINNIRGEVITEKSFIMDKVNTTYVDMHFINNTNDTMHLNNKNNLVSENFTRPNSTSESYDSHDLVPETSTEYSASTEIVNISESVTEGSFQTATDKSTIGLVDLILGTPSIRSIVDTNNNSNYYKNGKAVNPYLTRQETNDTGNNKILSEADISTEATFTEMHISGEQMSTIPTLNTNLEGFNNTDINYDPFTEFNLTDQITTTHNVSETNIIYFNPETVPSPQTATENNFVSVTTENFVNTRTKITTFVDVFKNDSFLEVPTTDDHPIETISTTDLPIVLTNNVYQIKPDLNQSLISENNTSDMLLKLNATQTIQTPYGISNTEPSLLVSSSAKHPVIERPIAKKQPEVLHNEITSHVKNYTSVTEDLHIINMPKRDIVDNDTDLKKYETTVPNDMSTKSVSQFTQVTNESPVTVYPNTVNEPKQDILQKNTVLSVYTTKAPNDTRTISVTKVKENSTLYAHLTEEINESLGTAYPNTVHEPKQKVDGNEALLTIYTTTAPQDIRIYSVPETKDNSTLSAHLTGVSNESPRTAYPDTVIDFKPETTQNNIVLSIYTTTTDPDDTTTNSVTDAADNSMLSAHLTGLTNKSSGTAYLNTDNEPKQDILQKNIVLSVYTTKAPNDTRTNSVTKVKENSTLSAHLTEEINESLGTAYPNTVHKPKQKVDENEALLTIYATTAPQDIRIYSVPEAKDNSTLSAHLTGVSNESPRTAYPYTVNDFKQETIQNNTVLSIYATTTTPDDTRTNSVTDAAEDSTLSAHLTGLTNESPGTAHRNALNESKQETVQSNTLLTIDTTTAPTDIRTNSVTDAADKTTAVADKERIEMLSAHLTGLTNGSPGTAYLDTVNESKQETVQKNTVLSILTTTTAPNDTRTNSVTDAADDSTLSAHLTGVTNESPGISNPNTLNDSKQETVQSNTVLSSNTTMALNDTRTNSDTDAADNSTLSAHLTGVTNELSGTSYPNTLNESKQDTVLSSYTTMALKDIRTNSDTDAARNSTLSAHLAGVTNESPRTAYPTTVSESKQETVQNNNVLSIYTTTATNDIRTNSVTEAVNNSTLSAYLTGVAIELPETAYPNTVNEENDPRLTTNTTSPPDLVKKNSVTEARDNFTFSAHFTGVTNESPVVAKPNNSTHSAYFSEPANKSPDYSNIVNELNKQETVENNKVLHFFTTAAPKKVNINSFTKAIHFNKETNDSAVKAYLNIANEPKKIIVENDALIKNYTTEAAFIVKNNSVTDAIINSTFTAHVTGRSNESLVADYPSIVNGPKHEIVENGAIMTTLAIENEDTNSVSEAIVKELSTEKNTRYTLEIDTPIEHAPTKIAVTNQANKTLVFSNLSKNLETTTMGELSSTKQLEDTDQAIADKINAYPLNLENSVSELFSLNVKGKNKTNKIASMNQYNDTASNAAMSFDAIPNVSTNIPEMPLLTNYASEPPSSTPETNDTTLNKGALKEFGQLVDGSINANIKVDSTTEYIAETSTAFEIDGANYTNVEEVSSFGVTAMALPDVAQKTYAQSKNFRTTVTTEKAFSSLGTSVDWNASVRTDSFNTETITSKVHSNNDVLKIDTVKAIRNITDKIVSPTVINNMDKSIKIMSEFDLVKSSDAVPNRKLEPSKINTSSSADYIKTTMPQDSSMYVTTEAYIPVYNFDSQVEEPVTKKLGDLERNPATTANLVRYITNTHNLPTVEINTENIKHVSGTETPLPGNTGFERITPTKKDFNFATEKLNDFNIYSQEPILSKLNKIPKVESQSLENNFMASRTISPNTFTTVMISDKNAINDASVFISSSTPTVPHILKNSLKTGQELPISKSKPTATQTTDYYNVKPVLPITEVPYVKITTDPSQTSKILTQPTFKSISKTNTDLPVIKTKDLPKLMIPTEKTAETVNLVTEPDSMVETITVESISNTVVFYNLTANNSNDGVKAGKNKIDHESIVIGKIYKNNELNKTTDFKLPVNDFKAEIIKPETDWMKTDMNVDTFKVTSVEEDSSKLSAIKSKSEFQNETFSLNTTRVVQVKPKVNENVDFVEITSVTMEPLIVTQIESTISKETQPKTVAKENEKTVVISASITANNKTSDDKSQVQVALKNTTESNKMNNTKVNVTSSYHQLSLQNKTFNDELAEDLISTNHTITAEVQSHLNESDKQSNKTNYAVTLNGTSTHNLNITAPKIISGDKGKSSISLPTSQDFNCLNHTRGKYSDKKDCRKFYTCIGNLQPMIGTCPNNTVFSEINKQCTRNLSHCVRNNQFRCLLEGRFSDFFKDNVYYICVKNNLHGFIRYKLECQSGYHLNKATVKCEKDEEISILSTSSISEANNEESTTVKIKSSKITKTDDFECKSEGKFPYDKDCKKYYVCTKNKNVYQWKIKKCGSDEIYDKKKKKCVDSDSGEC